MHTYYVYVITGMRVCIVFRWLSMSCPPGMSNAAIPHQRQAIVCFFRKNSQPSLRFDNFYHRCLVSDRKTRGIITSVFQPRKAVKKDQGQAAVDEAVAALTDLLVTDGMILSPEGAVAAAADVSEAGGSGEKSYVSELGYFLTWDDYKEAYHIENWNYNDMAETIQGVANTSTLPEPIAAAVLSGAL